MNKYAVITNDLQVAATIKHPDRKQQVEKFLPLQIEFLRKIRSLGVPVIHLRLISNDDDPRNEGIPENLQFRREAVGSKILDSVLDPKDIVVEKHKDSGFFRTALDETLHSLGTDTLIITGMQTQICVQTTAADAHFRGYNVLVPSDGVVSSWVEDTEQALKWMANYCAKVLTSNEIVNLVGMELSGGKTYE